MLSREDIQIQLQKYYNAWGNNVGQNFRHCKTKKGWIELANNGDIDCKKTFEIIQERERKNIRNHLWNNNQTFGNIFII